MTWNKRDDGDLPTATVRDRAGADRLLRRLARRVRGARAEPAQTALIRRPRWYLIDVLEERLHIARRPALLDVLYERSEAARKGVLRDLLLFLLFTALLRFLV